MSDPLRSIIMSDPAELTISHLCLSALPRARKELLPVLSLRFAKFRHSPNPLNAPAAPQPRVATARHPAPPPDAFERRIRLGGPPVGVAIASDALPSPHNPPVVEIGQNGSRGGTQKSVEVRWTRY